MPVETIERRGLATFAIGESQFTVDVYLTSNEVYVIDQECRDGSGAELPEYMRLLISKGAPADITAMEAVAVIKKIYELVDQEKKRNSTPSSSPSPSDSTPGDSNPGKEP